MYCMAGDWTGKKQANAEHKSSSPFDLPIVGDMSGIVLDDAWLAADKLQHVIFCFTVRLARMRSPSLHAVHRSDPLCNTHAVARHESLPSVAENLQVSIVAFIAAQYLPPLQKHSLWIAAAVSISCGLLKELGDHLQVCLIRDSLSTSLKHSQYNLQ